VLLPPLATAALPVVPPWRRLTTGFRQIEIVTGRRHGPAGIVRRYIWVKSRRYGVFIQRIDRNNINRINRSM
jgi:hypothetical protein